MTNMDRRSFLQTAMAAAMATEAPAAQIADRAASDRLNCDVFVYGSTPGGVASAVQAARRGAQVVLACPKSHPGGMAASGLCTTDAIREKLFGGIVTEFVSKVRQEYVKLLDGDTAQFKLIRDGWFYEPSVAEQVFLRLLEDEEKRLRWLPAHWLDGATVKDRRVTEVELEGKNGSRVVVSSRIFIDATYEGDLAAAAKVPYRVSREGRDEYGESFAGIFYMNMHTLRQVLTADTGEPSIAIQAFCERNVFTDDPEQRVPIEKPATYEQHLQDYLPLVDDFATGRMKSWDWGTPLPRRKYQMNGDIAALTSVNCPGVSWAWPEAERRYRERIEQFHVDHAAGLIYFLQNDSRVPDAVRNHMKPLGLHRQEFQDSGHWPWQLYVRQGRRIEGRDIVTQRNFTFDPKIGRTPRVAQPIAIGEYPFDVHPCQDRRFAVDGCMEGVISYHRRGVDVLNTPAKPGQIPYGAMLPKNLDNLLVPVALSSTHVAMSVIRMEPVWMTTGQVAGLAAAVALEQRLDVAHIDPVPLPGMLKIPVDPYADVALLRENINE
jgi:hypothetical protein